MVLMENNETQHNHNDALHFFTSRETISPPPGQIKSITRDKPTASNNGIVVPLHIVAMHIYCDVFTVIEHQLQERDKYVGT